MASHLSELRDVTITGINSNALSLDGYKAVISKVSQLEDQYRNSLDEDGVSQNLDDLDEETSVLTGNTPYKIYVFTLTTTFSTGTYNFEFVESAPNVESAPTLNT